MSRKMLFSAVMIVLSITMQPTVSQVAPGVLVGNPAPAPGFESAAAAPAPAPAAGFAPAGFPAFAPSESLTASNATSGNQTASASGGAPVNGSVPASNGTEASANGTSNLLGGFAPIANPVPPVGNHSSGSGGPIPASSNGSAVVPSVVTTLSIMSGHHIPENIKRIIKRVPEMVEWWRALYQYFVLDIE